MKASPKLITERRVYTPTDWFLRFASHTKLTASLYVFNFILCTVLGTSIEHLSFNDSVWWCTVTWFTVGYGDLYPLTGYGRLFGIYVIVSSHVLIVLVTANFVSKLSQFRADARATTAKQLQK